MFEAPTAINTQLTGQVRESGLATGEGQARSTGLGGSRSSRAKGNAGRVAKKSSHCDEIG
jgi:hypothetical protein